MKVSLLRSCLAILPVAAALFLAGCSTPDPMEASRRAIIPLAGSETFFDGKITAQITLGSPIAAPGPGKHRRSSFQGNGDKYLAGSDDSENVVQPDLILPHSVESVIPPALLHVRLDNTSSEKIDVEIRELNSELGNFATRPDKFSLEPGASGEPNGMQSLLGVESLALPVTLTLSANGKSETKVLTLRPVANSAPATK